MPNNSIDFPFRDRPVLNAILLGLTLGFIGAIGFGLGVLIGMALS